MNPLQSLDAIDLLTAYPTCANAVEHCERVLPLGTWCTRHALRHAENKGVQAVQEELLGLASGILGCSSCPMHAKHLLDEIMQPAFLNYLRAKVGAV